MVKSTTRDKIRRLRKVYRMGVVSYGEYLTQLFVILFEAGRGRRLNRTHKLALDLCREYEKMICGLQGRLHALDDLVEELKHRRPA